MIDEKKREKFMDDLADSLCILAEKFGFTIDGEEVDAEAIVYIQDQKDGSNIFIIRVSDGEKYFTYQ